MEWAPEVRCNAIVVGLVDNPEQAEHYGGVEAVRRIAAGVPMRRLATGDDVAACVAMLAADTAHYLTGATIDLHGGGELPAFLAIAGGAPPP
jgi:NAD(P)-dependent dehydrogenase (short-subunit alcohol dehydrogenase family)